MKTTKEETTVTAKQESSESHTKAKKKKVLGNTIASDEVSQQPLTRFFKDKR
jgi:hypothetical protein